MDQNRLKIWTLEKLLFARLAIYRISDYRKKQVPDGEGDSVDQPIDEPSTGQASKEDEPEPNSDVDLIIEKGKMFKNFLKHEE